MNEMCLDVKVNDSPTSTVPPTITQQDTPPIEYKHTPETSLFNPPLQKGAVIQKTKTVFEDLFSKEVWASTYKDHEDTDVNDTMFRVAHAVASMEITPELRAEWTEKFYDLLSGFNATAGGRIYANAGTSWGGTTLMNCYVAPRGSHDIDSLDSILNALKAQSQTLKSEGGWGENFSYIRPRGSFIHGIGVESPGSVKYMEMFDKSSEIITSGSGKKSTNKKAKGKIRKGAMMGVLDIWHPDIIEFITAKQQPGRLTKFNISVNCSDEFMDRIDGIASLEKYIQTESEVGANVERGGLIQNALDQISELDSWDLVFPDTMHPRYRADWNGDIKKWKSKGYPVVVHHTVSVKMLWNLIMESTYNRAEPGVLFLDRANFYGPLNYAETIFATNPCGEQTLAPGNVCNLGSLNLVHFLNSDRTGFDLDKIKKYTQYMVRFLDNVSDLSKAPLPEYEWSMRNKRRIGVGILGWGSALYMLKTRFGSDEAATLREELMKTIATTAYSYSVDLAEEKGMFSVCEPEKHAAGAFVQGLDLPHSVLDKMKRVGIRNSSLLSIQPTGNCVTENSIIRTTDGDKTIGELISTVVGIECVREGDVIKLAESVKIPTFEGDDEFDSVYVNGLQEVLQLKLDTGDTLEQTLNHKYLVKVSDEFADWVEAKDITPGMKIIAME